MDYLLDSNIIIYASKPEKEYLREFIKKHSPSVSFVSIIEVLGFSFTNSKEKEFLEDFFNSTFIHFITIEIINKATLLKQNKRMSLGDAIIAATVIENNLTLITHNTKDFDWIKEIKLRDPLIE